ncbi:MAG: glycoside hydrolase domain-containing protein [Chloroflexota bacterium]
MRVSKYIRTLTALCLAAMLLALGASAQAKPEAVVTIPSIDAFEQVSARAGWVLFGGKLYWTKTEGAAWTDITPAANIQAVEFLDASHGWAVVSVSNGYSLASTTDGGRAWQTRALRLPALRTADASIAKIFMNWRTESHGWLVFKFATGINFSRGMLFVTFDGGETWTERELPLGEPVTFTDENNGWISGGPTGAEFFVTRDGGRSWESDSESRGPLEVQGETRWKLAESGECAGGVCQQEVQLLTGGGIPMRLPNGQTFLRRNFSSAQKTSLFTDPDTTAYVGQGFDKCEIPTLPQMQTWWNNSPYSAVNLYIGGSMRACGNAALDAEYLTKLYNQGWKFIPTWVGLQAACNNNYGKVMSYDTTTAYNQGVAEAKAAIAVAQSLGLTNSNGSGTVIYYDLEKYSEVDTDCRNSATAFVSGWTYQMQLSGNLAGVYASPLNAVDWWGIENQPDAVWLAHWTEDSYTSDASVYGSRYIPDTYWNSHRRLRQYAGGHDETWGGTKLNIDSDVLDGPLTVPDSGGGIPTPAAPTGLTADSVTSTGTHLTWTASTDTVDNYLVFMDGVQAASVSGGTTSYDVQNLACNSTHSFYVKAVKDNIQSAASNHVNITTTTCAPTLLSPIGIVVDSLQPELTWQAVDGALGYQIQVSLRADFATFAINANSLTTSYTPTSPLLVKRRYYWRVTAVNASGASDWASSTFITPNPPPAPLLVSPAANALVTDYTPRLDWADVTVPTGTVFGHYQIQVATNTNFTSPVQDATATLSEFTVPVRLLPNTVYYWHVRAANSLGHYGAWSATRSFRSAIRAPVLLSPANGTTLLDRRPRFDWRNAVGASGYTLQISKYSNFAILMVNAPTIASAFNMPGDLPANTTLYWRVRANGVNGPSLWSRVWRFRTGNPPSVPALTSPRNAAILDDLTPRLTWRASTVPAGTTFSHYQIQIATDSTFASPLLDTTVSALSPAEFTLTDTLAVNTKYYWRVRAFNTKGEYSAWSVVWYFRMSATAVFVWMGS